MNKIKTLYKEKVAKALTMLLAVGFTLTAATTLTSCSTDDDPYFTVTEDDSPRILNTDLADVKIDRKTNFKLEIKVTPVHYTTVTWLLDGTQIFEGLLIDQTLPVGNHELKIVATTTKGKITSRTLNVNVTPAADDPALGTNALELWVAPGATTLIHKCSHLDNIVKVLVGGKEAAFEVLDEGTTLRLTAPADMANGDYAISLVTSDGIEFPGGTIKVTTEPKPSMENVLWEGEHYLSWDKGDDDPNKTFNLIPEAEVAKWKEGQVLRAYLKVNDADAYHQAQMNTAWWTAISEKIEFSADTVLEHTLTQGDIDNMAAQNGFIMTGHGYYVVKFTVE